MNGHLNWPQTIGALHAQARAASWSATDLAALVNAHAAIEPLFVGWRRASGRCFTSHLVGTASLALEFGGDPHEVLAALTHAVFDEGAYGRADGRFREEAESALAAAVPVETHILVAGYSSFSWPRFVDAAEAGIAAAVRRADPRLIRLRIVNEIDDALDWPFFADASRSSGMRECAIAAEVASEFGWEALAERAAFVAAEMAKVPAAFAARDAAYFVRPIGYLRPFSERVIDRFARLIQR